MSALTRITAAAAITLAVSACGSDGPTLDDLTEQACTYYRVGVSDAQALEWLVDDADGDRALANDAYLASLDADACEVTS